MDDIFKIKDNVLVRCTNKRIKEVTIPSNVNIIGEDAFYKCINLTSIVIPKNIPIIKKNAFRGCKKLEYIDIQEGVSIIEDFAFADCNKLDSIIIPKSVSQIGKAVFCGCENLSKIIVKKGNFEYDSRENCNAIVETSTNEIISACQNTTFPNSITSIGKYSFAGCRNLTNIIIPSTITNIGDLAFWLCESLIDITIPNSVKSIGESVFSNCKSLASVSIPSSITNIPNRAFWMCESLTNITIPNSVTRIGDCAFNDCSSLSSITIPNSVISIGGSAFAECSGLTSITIPDSVTSIGTGVFYGCSGLKDIPVHRGVLSIAEDEFSYCTGLTSVTLPSNITSIESGAFSHCENLEKIFIPKSVKFIGDAAFMDCKKITVYFDGERDPAIISNWEPTWADTLIDGFNLPVVWGCNKEKTPSQARNTINNKENNEVRIEIKNKLESDIVPRVLKKGITINDDNEYSIGAEILVEGRDVEFLDITIQFLDSNENVLEEHESYARVVNSGVFQFGEIGIFKCPLKKYKIVIEAESRLTYTTKIKDAVSISNIKVIRKDNYYGNGDPEYFVTYVLKNKLPIVARFLGYITFYDENKNIVGGLKLEDNTALMPGEEQLFEENITYCHKMLNKAKTFKYSLDCSDASDELASYSLEEMEDLHYMDGKFDLKNELTDDEYDNDSDLDYESNTQQDFKMKLTKVKFLNKSIEANVIQTKEDFFYYIKNLAPDVYRSPFAWLDDIEFIDTIFDAIDVDDFRKFKNETYKIGDELDVIDVVCYNSHSAESEELFYDGSIYDVDFDVARKMGIQNQTLNYYYDEKIFYGFDDSPRIAIFDTEKNYYELFKVLIPNPVFVRGKNGKIYAIFSGYLC